VSWLNIADMAFINQAFPVGYAVQKNKLALQGKVSCRVSKASFDDCLHL